MAIQGLWGGLSQSWRPQAFPAWPASLVLLGAFLLPGTGYAQSSEGSFEVEVVPSESQTQVTSQGRITVDTATLQMRALQRIADGARTTLRLGAGSAGNGNNGSSAGNLFPVLVAALDLAELSLAQATDSEAGEGYALDFGRWNLFGDLRYGLGKQDDTPNSPKHTVDTISASLGADYRLSPNAVVGALFGFLRNATDFSGDSGRVRRNVYSIGTFAAWYPASAWFVDGIARFAVGRHEIRREATNASVINGSPFGRELSLGASTGYDARIGGAGVVSPRLRLLYTKVDINAYAERGDDASVLLAYQEQETKSFTSNLGFDASYAINTRIGVVLPQLLADWVHDFRGDRRNIQAESAGGAGFVLPTNNLDRDYVRLGAGVVTVLPRGHNLFVQFETELGRANVSNHSIQIGYRHEL